jgi:hypothetical protein
MIWYVLLATRMHRTEPTATQHTERLNVSERERKSKQEQATDVHTQTHTHAHTCTHTHTHTHTRARARECIICSKEKRSSSKKKAANRIMTTAYSSMTVTLCVSIHLVQIHTHT